MSRDALRDAAYVAAAFAVITRFADAIGARAHSEMGLTREQAVAHEGQILRDRLRLINGSDLVATWSHDSGLGSRR